MKFVLRAIGVIVVLLARAAAAIYFTGNLPTVDRHDRQTASRLGPGLQGAGAGLCEGERLGRAAIRSRRNRLVPAGVASPAPNPGVDVFFVHPTGYLTGGDWNSPLDPNTGTEENTKWMMANQASVFNGCCAVYAPRYREATIYRYISAPPDIAKKAADSPMPTSTAPSPISSSTIPREGRFIIASHSQGTEHAFRLVRERIDGTPLEGQFVAAYLIGLDITDKQAGALKTIRVCATATDLRCIIHWATFGEGFAEPQFDTKDKLVCVNPLNWQRDGGLAPEIRERGRGSHHGRLSR